MAKLNQRWGMSLLFVVRTVIGGLSSFAFVLFYAAAAWASAWTLEPKKSQTIVTSAYSKAGTLLDENGESVKITNFSKLESRLYTEIGLVPSLMFVGQTGFQTINFQGAGSNVIFDDFGETKLGLQYSLKQKEGFAAAILGSYIIDGGLDDPRLNIGGA